MLLFQHSRADAGKETRNGMNKEKAASQIHLKEEIRRFLETAPDIYMPGVSVDTVIFGFHNNKIRVLLLQFADTKSYVLPGGYILKEEHLDDAALRILQERTCLKDIYLEQFYAAGSIDRSTRIIEIEMVRELFENIPQREWFEQRFVSVCYYALVDETKVNPMPQPFFPTFKWFDVSRLPRLLHDHALIISKALERLQSDLDDKLAGFNLPAETFTMGELQKLYEAVHQKEFVRTNFQRKMLGLNLLERLEKQYSGKSHKAPYLYRFKKE